MLFLLPIIPLYATWVRSLEKKLLCFIYIRHLLLYMNINEKNTENQDRKHNLPIDFIENSINEKNPIPWLVMQ